MAQILPFLSSNVGFDPETINILSNAFEDAWRRIEASNSRLARPAYANAGREVVAKHIIEMAQRGEREPVKLTDSAVAFLAANYKD
jgi:hypothetical protein